MTDAASLVHLMEPGAPRAEAARAHLAARFRVVVVDARESAGAVLHALDGAGVSAFSLLATAGASHAVAALAREAGTRLLALVLESPDAPGPADIPAAPALVVLGTRDTEAAQGAGVGWVDRIPGSHLVYVYAAGHAVGEDRPEAFAEVVGDFLERHDAFVISRTTTVIHP
jgi:pimeloyl-ACP methyl ester carboxylesterase